MTTVMLIAAAFYGLRNATPEWKRQLEENISNDKNAFEKFRLDVFKTINECKHPLGEDGFEKVVYPNEGFL